MDTFFISYNSADRRWAEWIAWQLENAGHRTILQAWDFRPGSNFVLEMQKAAGEANRTVAVLSTSYLKSRFTQPEWAAAFARDPTGEKRILVPVRVEECEPTGLLPGIVFIDLVGASQEQARMRLIAGLSGDRAKPQAAPAFPGREPARGSGTAPVFPGLKATGDSGLHPAAHAGTGGSGAALATASILENTLDLEFPAYVIGLAASSAMAKFHVAQAPAKISMEFRQRQGALIITTNSQHATNVENPFELQFTEPGEYEVEFEVFTSELKDLNDLVTVIASSERVLLRRSYRISAFTGKKESLPAAVLRLLEQVKGHWKAVLSALALAAVAVYAAQRYKGKQDWPTTLGLRAPDYILDGGSWKSDFQPDSWNYQGGAKLNPRPGRSNAWWLNVDGTGFASPRLSRPPVRWLINRPPALYDFEAVFNISFRADGAAQWIFRARPNSDSRSGYYFTLRRKTLKVDDAVTSHFTLLVQRCSDPNHCTDLGQESEPFCSACDQVTIQARARGGIFQIIPQFLTTSKACPSITDQIAWRFQDSRESFRSGEFVFGADGTSHFDVDYLLLGGLGSKLFPDLTKDLQGKP